MTHPQPTPKPVTFEEVARLDPDTEAGELDRGRWVPMTKNTWRHGELVGNVYAVLRSYARARGGWSVSVGDPGAKLSRDPDVLRGPDVGIVRGDRRPSGTGASGWLEGAPDVAVEVIGDAQAAADITRRALEYLAAGALRVWVLDPSVEQVLVYAPPNVVRVLSKQEELDGEDALPGFRCAVAELFE